MFYEWLQLLNNRITHLESLEHGIKQTNSILFEEILDLIDIQYKIKEGGGGRENMQELAYLNNHHH